MADRCAYWLYLPSLCRTTISYPYAPAHPADTTFPAATAFTEVPVGTGKSTPVW
jgi:hypothetical protein